MRSVRSLVLAALIISAAAFSGCGGGGGGGGNGGGGNPGTKPAAPTSLTATRGAVQLSHFSLAWTPSSSTGVVRYNIYRKLESEGSFGQVGTSPAAPYLDTSVPASVAFDQIQYFVTAVNNLGVESDASNIFTVVQTGGPPPPPFPAP